MSARRRQRPLSPYCPESLEDRRMLSGKTLSPIAGKGMPAPAQVVPLPSEAYTELDSVVGAKGLLDKNGGQTSQFSPSVTPMGSPMMALEDAILALVPTDAATHRTIRSGNW